MTKRLQKHGNSHALIIDKALMEATGIGPDTPLNVTVHAGTIMIAAANVGLGRERVDQIMDRVERDYGKALKRLAD
jgi:antitoxin component of MazEF toxin-antitoxin module